MSTRSPPPTGATLRFRDTVRFTIMRLKHLIISLLTLAVVGTGSILLLAPGSVAQVPDVTITTLNGQQLRISDLRGRPVLISFWATNCEPCLREIPDLVQIHDELAPRGLELIAVAMAYDQPARVQELSRAAELPYTVALDTGGTAARAFGDVEFTPSAFLIAPNGTLAHSSTGPLDPDALRALIVDLLAEAERTLTSPVLL